MADLNQGNYGVNAFARFIRNQPLATDGGSIDQSMPSISQSFQIYGDPSSIVGVLQNITVAMNRQTSPGSGTISAKIYTHSGTYGKNSLPDTLVASSVVRDISTLGTTPQMITFDFSPTGYVVYPGQYVLTVETSGADDSGIAVWWNNNGGNYGKDTTNETGHDGNAGQYFDGFGWIAYAWADLNFTVNLYALGESVITGEEITTSVDLNVNVNDTQATAEPVTLLRTDLDINVNDTRSITEYKNVAIANLSINKNDTISRTESVSRSITNPGINVNDQVPTLEDISITFGSLLPSGDDILVVDLPTVKIESYINKFEEIALNEDISLSTSDISLSLSVIDTPGVTEDRTVSLGTLELSCLDNISVEDSPIFDSTVVSVNVYDSTSIVDAPSVLPWWVSNNGEDISILDNVSLSLSLADINVNDQRGITDIVTTSNILGGINVLDSINTTEEPTLTIGSGSSNLVISDNQGISENIILGLDISLNVSDSISNTEYAATSISGLSVGSIIESLDIEENTTQNLSASISTSSAISPTDSPSISEVLDNNSIIVCLNYLSNGHPGNYGISNAGIWTPEQNLDTIFKVIKYDGNSVDISEDVSVKFITESVNGEDVTISEDIILEVPINIYDINDQIGITDEATVSISDIEINTNDETGITDICLIDLSGGENTYGEDVSISEDLNVELSLGDINVFDQITISDSPSLSYGDYEVSSFDTINISDILSTPSLGALLISVDDLITISDTPEYLNTIDLIVAEDQVISDAPTVVLDDLAIEQDENIEIVSEQIDVSIESETLPGDDILITEDVQIAFAVETSTTDDIGISEDISVILDDIEINVSEEIVTGEDNYLEISGEGVSGEDITISEDIILETSIGGINVQDGVDVTDAASVALSDYEVSAIDLISINDIVSGPTIETITIWVADDILITDTPDYLSTTDLVVAEEQFIVDQPELIISDGEIGVTDSVTIEDSLGVEFVSDAPAGDDILISEDVQIAFSTEAETFSELVIDEEIVINLDDLNVFSGDDVGTEDDLIVITDNGGVVVGDDIQVNENLEIELSPIEINVNSTQATNEDTVVLSDLGDILAIDVITPQEAPNANVSISGISVWDEISIIDGVDFLPTLEVFTPEVISIEEDISFGELDALNIEVSDDISLTEEDDVTTGGEGASGDDITIGEDVDLDNDLSVNISENGQPNIVDYWNHSFSLPIEYFDYILYSQTDTAIGQYFLANGKTLDSCRFVLKKTGTPTGNILVKIYNTEILPGGQAIPTGPALATSEPVTLTSIPSSIGRYVEFKFEGINNISLPSGYYFAAIEYLNSNLSNRLEVAFDPDGNHSGNIAYYSTVNGWTVEEGAEGIPLIFQIYSEAEGEPLEIVDEINISIDDIEIQVNEDIGTEEDILLSRDDLLIIIEEDQSLEDIIEINSEDTGINILDEIEISDFSIIDFSPSESSNGDDISISEDVVVDIPIEINVGDDLSLTEDTSFNRTLEIIQIGDEGVIASYEEDDSGAILYDDFWIEDDIQHASAGQSFIANGDILVGCQFYLKISSYFYEGNITASIYNHEGNYGVDGIPSGPPLATSNAILSSTVPLTGGNVKFIFTGDNKIILEDGQKYFVTINYFDNTSNSFLSIGYSNSEISSGNRVEYYTDTNWEYIPYKSTLLFTVYGEGRGETIKIKEPVILEISDLNIETSDDILVEDEVTQIEEGEMVLIGTLLDDISLSEDISIYIDDIIIETHENIPTSEEIIFSGEAELSIEDSISILDEPTIELIISDINIFEEVNPSEDIVIENNNLPINTTSSLSIGETSIVTRESSINSFDTITPVATLVSVNLSTSIDNSEEVSVLENQYVKLGELNITVQEDISINEEASFSISQDIWLLSGDDVFVDEGIEVNLEDIEISSGDSILIEEEQLLNVDFNLDIGENQNINEVLDLEVPITLVSNDTVEQNSNVNIEISDLEISVFDDLLVLDYVDSVGIVGGGETLSGDSISINEDVQITISGLDIATIDSTTTTDSAEINLNSEIDARDNLDINESLLIAVEDLEIPVADVVDTEESIQTDGELYAESVEILDIAEDIFIYREDFPLIYDNIDLGEDLTVILEDLEIRTYDIITIEDVPFAVLENDISVEDEISIFEYVRLDSVKLSPGRPTKAEISVEKTRGYTKKQTQYSKISTISPLATMREGGLDGQLNQGKTLLKSKTKGTMYYRGTISIPIKGTTTYDREIIPIQIRENSNIQETILININ
jgi:hypothetical protein